MSVQDYFKVPDTEPNYGMTQFYGNPKKVPDESILPQITLEVLGFTRESVKEQLLGMDHDLVDPATNKPYTDAFYDHMIEQSVGKVENELNIVIRPRLVNERLDYNEAEYNSYMYLRTTQRPILQVDKLMMQFNNSPVMDYPDKWIKVTNLFGQIEVQPTLLMQSATGMIPNSLTIAGYPSGNPTSILPNMNPMWAPQMIGCTYVAGMLPPRPEDRGINQWWFPRPDLIAYVAKQATIEVLERWGRLILGAGIAGYGINVDGISTQVDSTQSAENTGSTADIKLLQTDMKNIKDGLVAYYGYNLGVLS